MTSQRTLWRLIGRAAAALGLLLLGAAAGSAVGLVSRPTPQMPPLLPSSPGDWSDALQRRFPIGSPEAGLIHELWVEGFRPTTALTAPSQAAEFVRRGDLLRDPCLATERVQWSADPHGNLTEVSGRRDQSCP
jgi:hypothetical protein